MKNFRKMLGFFEIVINDNYNHEFYAPNVLELLKLVMMHPATTASCERSFRLSKLIKSDMQTTMTHERFNYLCIIQHCECMLSEMHVKDLIREFMSFNDRRKKHFGRVTRRNMRVIISGLHFPFCAIIIFGMMCFNKWPLLQANYLAFHLIGSSLEE